MCVHASVHTHTHVTAHRSSKSTQVTNKVSRCLSALLYGMSFVWSQWPMSRPHPYFKAPAAFRGLFPQWNVKDQLWNTISWSYNKAILLEARRGLGQAYSSVASSLLLGWIHRSLQVSIKQKQCYLFLNIPSVRKDWSHGSRVLSATWNKVLIK